MDLSSGGVAAMVFKPVIRGDLGKLSLDGQMLSVLMALDGQLTVEQVARKIGISLDDIRGVITKLSNLNLVLNIERAISIIDEDFMQVLIARMSMAIGPLGEIIVEDGLEELGFNRNNFPSLRTAELVNYLAQEIQREDKRIEFKQAMLKKIKEKGY